MLTIYRGRESLDKEKFIYREIRQAAGSAGSRPPACGGARAEGPGGPAASIEGVLPSSGRTIVVVPDQYTLAAEKQAMDRLNEDVLLDIEITGISRLGSKILDEVGRGKETVIDQYGRHMLISVILRELDSELEAFQGFYNRESFVEAINDFISAAKQHQVSPESLSSLALASEKDMHKGAFARKLRDLSKIFTAYEKKLQGKYTDNENMLEMFIEGAEKSTLVKKSNFWFYGFDSYTPKNMRFIAALAKSALGVNVFIPYDENCPDAELFELSGETTERLRRACADQGVETKVIDIKAPVDSAATITAPAGDAATAPAPAGDESLRRVRAKELSILERELFASVKTPYSLEELAADAAKKSSAAETPLDAAKKSSAAETTADAAKKARAAETAPGAAKKSRAAETASDTTRGPIEIVECLNMTHEAEAAASYVLSLLQDEEMNLSDIVVICNDQKNGAPIIGRAFREYGLGVFDDRKRSVVDSPIAIYILTLLDVICRGYRREDVIRFAKTGLTDLETAEIEELENYALKYGIKSWMWREPFVLGTHEHRYREGGLEKLEEARLKLNASFSSVSEIAEASGTYGEFAEKYYELLTKEDGLASKVEKLLARQQEAGLMESAEETAQIWDVVQRLFSQIAEIMSEEPFDLRMFSDILRSGLSAMEVGVLPPTADDLLLGTMQRTRSGDVRALIVIGANDGLIPRRDEEDVLFSPEELELLSDDGEELGLGSSLRLAEENLAIYRNFAAPTERLWISYSAKDSSGHEALPSEIVKSIREIFPDLKITEDPIIADDFGFRLGGRINTMRRYTEAKRKEKLGQKMNPSWKEVEKWLRTTDDVLFAKVRDALEFENVKDPLPAELAVKLYSKDRVRDGKPAFILSASKLEKYRKCPFSYFVGFGIGAEELRINEAGYREIGDLYHGALQGIMDELTKSGTLDTASREDVEKRVEEISEEWAADYRSNVFERNGYEKYKFRRAVEACKFVAWTLVNQAREGEIKESYFEVPFEIPSNRRNAPDADGAADFAGAESEPGDEGAPLVLPAITKDVSSGRAFIRGVIDRVDILPDGRVKIIDYKTGNEKFNKVEVENGYRLQLMLYLEAAREGKRKPAGVFYFLIKEPEVDLATIKKAESKEDAIAKSYQMDGVLIDSDEVIREIAGEIPPGESSKVVNLRTTSKGALDGKYTKILLTDADFDELQSKVDSAVDEIIENMTKGEIPLTVRVSGNYSPCTYCDYQGICRFDKVFEGCKEIDIKKP